MIVDLVSKFPSKVISSDFRCEADTAYIINDVVLLTGSITLDTNTTLIFQGGAFIGAGVIICNGGFIEGNGYLFRNNVMLTGTFLQNKHLNAEWFGVTPSSSHLTTSDVSSFVNKAIYACHNTNVCKLYFPSGYYYINSTVYVSRESTTNEDTSRNWDLQIYGMGNNYSNGTVFRMGDNGNFYVNMRNISNGNYRGGGFYNCMFWGVTRGKQNNPILPNSKAISIYQADTYQIYKCTFKELTTGVELRGNCYYVDTKQCIFNTCHVGIASVYDPGPTPEAPLYDHPNNNIVDGCMFIFCDEHPINITQGRSWHIMNCNIEGNNGPIVLDTNCRITHVRFERNDSNKNWLIVSNRCEVEAEFHGDAEHENDIWRVVCNGDNNRIRIRAVGLHSHLLASYGKGNQFFITTEQDNTSVPYTLLFNPEDELILNGYSNRSDYIGTNRVVSSDLTRNTSIAGIPCSDGICYPASGKSTIRFYLDEIPQSIYKSCLFHINSSSSESNITVNLFNGFTMRNVSGWFCCVKVLKKSSNLTGYVVGYNQKDLYTTNPTQQVCIYNATISVEKPLYNRPALNVLERDTFNPLRPDGTISLKTTYTNKTTTTFGLLRDSFEVYRNRLGKTFHSYNNHAHHISDGYSLGGGTGNIITVDASGNLPYIIRDLLIVEVELFDVKNGGYLSLKCSRTNTSNIFTVQVHASIGLTYVNNNQHGTIAIAETNRSIVPWIKVLS